MLTSSQDVKRRLERDGWRVVRIVGSHHIFRHTETGAIIVLPHPKKDLSAGLVRRIYREAGWAKD